MKISQIRYARHISVETLAKRSGVNQSTITRIENNMADPRLSTLIAIAKALHVNITDLYEERHF